MTLFFNTWGKKARCQDPDVDPDWWVEPDLEVADYQGDVRFRDAINSLLIESRINALRAKIICGDCPLLDKCREAAWNEGHHVWGGLDASERYRVRTAGTYAVLPTPDHSHRKHNWRENERVKRFLAGDSVEDIARDEGIQPNSVMNTMRWVLASQRSEREGSEEWRSRHKSPPSLEGMTQPDFRHGRAVSQTWEAESA